ncbi:hypothetical protein Tco_1004799 [Tanacetum coccineum]|uniref:Zinc finger, CCHC-type n=1 Tax=Tanacetum coccineum TaxID=301880 RepID=A0ABQ5FCW7_9ASTR
MNDLGGDVVLSIRIKHESNGILISQSPYIDKVSWLPDVCLDLYKAWYWFYNGKTKRFGLLALETYTSNLSTHHCWLSNTEENYSTSGWVFLLMASAISWASKKKTCITSLIMEYEFVALAVVVFMRSQENLTDHLTKGLAKELDLKSAKWMGLKTNLGMEHMYLHIIPRMCLDLLNDRLKGFLLNGSFEKVQGRCMNKETTYVNMKFCRIRELWASSS